jgi:hypothetical protein
MSNRGGETTVRLCVGSGKVGSNSESQRMVARGGGGGA